LNTKKIEIQLLSSIPRQQLIQFRDEIRLIDGMSAFELQCPPLVPTPGTMSGDSWGELISFALIGGTIEASTAIGLVNLYELVSLSLKKVIENNPDHQKDEAKKIWETVVSSEENGSRVNMYLDSEGVQKKISNREYSINPKHTHAIIIGNSEYDDGTNFSPIPPVRGNVEDIYKVLIDKRLVGLSGENICLLRDEVSVVIKSELNKISKMPDIETLIIYYAGHGQNVGNNQLSLIAKDTRNIDEELHNDIPYSFIEKIKRNSPAAQKIIFIDACRSGLATQDGSKNIFATEHITGSFVLASTSAEESSCFKKDARNTYFTKYLLEVFKNGITNTKTMLSLADLYEQTKINLTKDGLPIPTCKPQLNNIAPEQFFISINSAFSLDELLKRPQKLYKQGLFEEARIEYLQLEKKYPDNEELKSEHVEFERNLKVKELIKSGDILFWTQKDFKEAKIKYQEAYELRPDELIFDKIRDCDIELGLIQKNNSQSVIIMPENKPWYAVLKINKGKSIIISTFILLVALVKVFILEPHSDVMAETKVLKKHSNTKAKVLKKDTSKKKVTIIDTSKLNNNLKAINPTDVIGVHKQRFAKPTSDINDNPSEGAFIPDSSIQPIFRQLAAEGKRYFKKNEYDKAFTLLYRARETNDPEVWFYLGYLYANGKGVKSNYYKSFKYYNRSAAQGNASAQNNLGWMYGNGKGVKLNEYKAIEWYRKSADQNFDEAQNNLGLMYEQGIGIEKNDVKAIFWYRKAAKQGLIEAKNNLNRLGYVE
jgi:tetratricopeptide (TPR) repeat protein